MKTEQKTEQKFEPITLTLETKEELLLITALLGGTSGDLRKTLTGVDISIDYPLLKALTKASGIINYNFLEINVSKYVCELK